MVTSIQRTSLFDPRVVIFFPLTAFVFPFHYLREEKTGMKVEAEWDDRQEESDEEWEVAVEVEERWSEVKWSLIMMMTILVTKRCTAKIYQQ